MSVMDAVDTTARSTNRLQLGLLRQPRQVLFGPGQRRQIPRVVSSLGERVLVVTDARMAQTPSFHELEDGLRAAGLVVLVFDKTDAELPRENVVDLVARVGDQHPDVLIGIGGGSCMDLAKVSAVILAQGGDVRDYYGEFRVPGPGLPVVTVPTTGGTGAEATCISVIFDAEKGMKVGVASPYLEADTAVIDPELTLSAPAGLTAATGADALSHLVEAFTGRAKNPGPDEIARKLYVGKNALADVYAREGIRLLGSSLSRLAKDLTDLQARSDTMFAAHCAGMAINTAGTAAAHALQSPVGNLTHTPHGFGVGALLPYVMRFNLPTRVPEFAQIGDLLGVCAPGMDESARARAGIERIDGILAELKIPADLSALGLHQEHLEYVTEQSLLATRLTDNNPRELTHETVREIFRRGLVGDRSWW